MVLTLRFRREGGASSSSSVATVSLSDSASIQDVIESAAASLNIARSNAMILLCGFPPKPLTISDARASAASAGIRSGMQIFVRTTLVGDGDPATPAPAADGAAAAPAALRAGAAATAAAASPPSTAASIIDAASPRWACGTCTYLNAPAAALSICAMCGAARPMAAAPRERVTRHVIPADNNCLFAAIGHCAATKDDLRAAVRAFIRAHADVYTEAVLGRPVAAYLAWISDKAHWGGAIECAILAECLGLEIAVVDIRTARAYIFGEGKSFRNRMYLLYDGVHYDCLVRPTQCIIDALDTDAMADAIAIASEMQRTRQFTNMDGFSLRCLVCSEGLTGAADAQKHAARTGHANFAEAK